MVTDVKERFGVYTYYEILSLPFDRDVSYPYQVSHRVDFSTLNDSVKEALISLPIVQFTGDFMAGGLDKKQRLYLMSKMDEIYFVDTLKSNYAKCVTKIDNVPDLSDKEVIERSEEFKSINLLRRSEDYKVTYKDTNYIIEITEEGSGTFTSITYDGNFVMDHMLEKDILEHFYKNK